MLEGMDCHGEDTLGEADPVEEQEYTLRGSWEGVKTEDSGPPGRNATM